jgi:polyphosphate glucokinase
VVLWIATPKSSWMGILDAAGTPREVGDVTAKPDVPAKQPVHAEPEQVSVEHQALGEGDQAGSGPIPKRPFTLAIDIGGSGLKASVLDASGAMVADRVRVPTRYPCSPDKLLDDLAEMIAPLPAFDRVSAGFPGMVREGLILTAPHFSTSSGPGTEPDEKLVNQWSRFAFADALTRRFEVPARIANDADLQGLAVVEGKGLEIVATLGTGFGTGMFYDGQLLPHFEFAHYPFRKGETYNEQLGEMARKTVGDERWNKRVRKAIETLRTLMMFDRCYLGGGNAKRVEGELEPDVTIVDNSAGILGGITLWEADHLSL